jgi:hypothetical protein
MLQPKVLSLRKWLQKCMHKGQPHCFVDVFPLLIQPGSVLLQGLPYLHVDMITSPSQILCALDLTVFPFSSLTGK